MIRWCAYCQKYLGEMPPFDSFELSHGICKGCQEAKVALDPRAVDRIRPVATYFMKVADAIHREESPRNLLDEGLELGLDPWDLLVGIIQPALRSMGEQWAHSVATICDEHQLTAVCTEILTLMEARQPGFVELPQARRPEVLLVNAEGNHHSLGLRLVEFFLATRAVPVLAIHQGLPACDIIRLIRSVRPRKLGISCALPVQIESARLTAEAIASLPESLRPTVFVGGYALRGLAQSLHGWPCRPCVTPADMLDPPLAAGAT
jgi:methanogenic corrinoid protein MtbC1